MDERTRNEIDKVVWQTLRDAGITRPPVSAELVLQHLELHRQYYTICRIPVFSTTRSTRSL